MTASGVGIVLDSQIVERQASQCVRSGGSVVKSNTQWVGRLEPTPAAPVLVSLFGQRRESRG